MTTAPIINTNDSTASIGYMAAAMPREMQRLLVESDAIITSLKHATEAGRSLIVVR